MGKKKSKCKNSMPKLTEKQSDIMDIISKTGCICEDNLKEFGLNKHTINKMVEFGFIKETRAIVDRNTSRTVYVADKSGQSYLKNYYGSSLYRHQSVHHDSQLNDRFVKVWDEYKNGTVGILTETQAKDLVVDKINHIEDYAIRTQYQEELQEHKISPSDMVIVREVNNVITYICEEVITVNYNAEMILAKEHFQEILERY